jgi:hypothetical protein
MEFYACSVHLTGGRFDDEAYEKIGSAREEQLRSVIDAVQAANESMSENGHTSAQPVPLVLAGDFNAHITGKLARQTLRSYRTFQQAAKKGREKEFLQYITSGHSFLHEKGFQAAYYPDGAPDRYVGARMNRTSKYGGVVDWIYFPQRIVSTKQQPKIIDSIGRGVSDHQAVQVVLQMPSSCAETSRFKAVKTGGNALFEGLGTAMPSMLAQWVFYAVQIRQTREVTSNSGRSGDVPSIHCSLKAVAADIFASEYPGRIMSTMAVGFSTFTFWFAFYFFESIAAFWGTLIASVCNVVVTTPLWTIIIRLQADTSEKPANWLEQVATIYEEFGIAGFFSGLTPNLFMIAFPIVQANIYYTIVQIIVLASDEGDEMHLHAKYKYLASVIAGMATLVATVATYPIQYVRVRWQTGLPILPSGDGASMSFFEVVRAVYAGIVTKLLHSMLTAAFVFFFKEQFYVWAVSG